MSNLEDPLGVDGSHARARGRGAGPNETRVCRHPLRRVKRLLSATLAVSCLSILLSGGCLLVFALEGLICLVMAAPLALGMALMGGLLGRAIALGGLARRGDLLAVLLTLPVLTGFERPAYVREPIAVVTSVDIDAPPARVWTHVVRFAELPEPPSWIFRLGIAHPRHARIEGIGPGAVRR